MKHFKREQRHLRKNSIHINFTSQITMIDSDRERERERGKWGGVRVTVNDNNV